MSSPILCYACGKQEGQLRKVEVYAHDGACSQLTSQGLIQLQQAIQAQLARASGAVGSSGVRSQALGGVPPDKIPVPKPPGGQS